MKHVALGIAIGWLLSVAILFALALAGPATDHMRYA